MEPELFQLKIGLDHSRKRNMKRIIKGLLRNRSFIYKDLGKVNSRIRYR